MVAIIVLTDQFGTELHEIDAGLFGAVLGEYRTIDD